MLNNLLALLGVGNRNAPGKQIVSRIAYYIRYRRMYDGWIIRENTSQVEQWKPLRFNYAQPIVNIGADFLAGKPITFTVNNNENAMNKADEIWTESGGSGRFHENATLAGIYGDACAILSKPEDEEVTCIRWLDPCICSPVFDPHDYERIMELAIGYEIPLNGRAVKYSEVWKEGTVTIKHDDTIVSTDSYDEEAFGGVPAVWIRNRYVKGDTYGCSDIAPVAELIEEYDHLCEKMTRIVDYYAAPNIMAKGISKKQMETLPKGERTMYFVGNEGDMKFIEWAGPAPGIDVHLDRVFRTIANISETPEIALSQQQDKIGPISGIALKLLFGPLLAKTTRKRTTVWEPALTRIMWMALLNEGIQVELDELSIEWQDPLPEDITAFWTTATQKDEVGVSKKQILREAGYTEEEIGQMEEERAKEQEDLGNQILKQFNSGQVAGSPYSTSGPPKPQDQQVTTKNGKSA